MTVNEVIEAVKSYCCSTDAFTGKTIDPATTRDQVTFGAEALGSACTGIVTCIWPTVEIVRRARELGANLIISHEAIFWNHGDHRDVVAGNSAFLAKIVLLEEWGGVVWRCHDYIHAGVPLEEDGSMADGIFYGLADKLGWLDCRIGRDCMDYEIPEMPARDVAAYVVKRLGLSGTRLIGCMDAPVRRVRVPMHIMGHPVGDTETLNKMDTEGVDCLLCMEIIDFTVSEYVRDSAMLGQGKCIIHMGHFKRRGTGHGIHGNMGIARARGGGLGFCKGAGEFCAHGGHLSVRIGLLAADIHRNAVNPTAAVHIQDGYPPLWHHPTQRRANASQWSIIARI